MRIHKVITIILVFAVICCCGNVEAVSTDTSVKNIIVSNYKEFLEAIGSNRQLYLLPGNYDPSDYQIEVQPIKNITNLTIKGMAIEGKKYTDITGDSLNFENCDKIKITNLNIIDGSIIFGMCEDILLDSSKISNEANNCLSIRDVNGFVCSNSIIDSSITSTNYDESEHDSYYYGILDVNTSEHVEFQSCTLKGYTLYIGEEQNGKVLFKNCSLINDAGICSTWSNYVPIKDESGYEIFIGTEEWNEWRFLAAIKYEFNEGYGVSYENTYDGNDEIFSDGKFLKLAEKLNTETNGNAFPSIDYTVGDDEDYNAYYDFYGTPKLKKLNINLNVTSPSDVNLVKMCQRIKHLKPLQQDILSYSGPISVVYRLDYFGIVAVADFSNNSFKEFINSEDISKIEDFCTVMLTDKCDAASFFDIKVKSSEKQVSKDITNKFLTNLLRIQLNDDYGQLNSIEFTTKNKDGIYYISTIESFLDQGDFMHYATDMIIKTNAITGEQYIASQDNDYKVLDLSSSKDKYRKVIFEQLQKNKALSKKIIGSACNDVLVFVENDKKDKEVSFIFLGAYKHNEEDESYSYSEYSFNYYLGTLDLNSNKVINIKNIDLVDFEEMIYN